MYIAPSRVGHAPARQEAFYLLAGACLYSHAPAESAASHVCRTRVMRSGKRSSYFACSYATYERVQVRSRRIASSYMQTSGPRRVPYESAQCFMRGEMQRQTTACAVTVVCSPSDDATPSRRTRLASWLIVNQPIRQRSSVTKSQLRFSALACSADRESTTCWRAPDSAITCPSGLACGLLCVVTDSRVVERFGSCDKRTNKRGS